MTLVPARVARPGEVIALELEARGWTQKDLAEIMGRPLQAVNEIVNGNKQVTPATAHELAQVFGTTPEVWMNLETNYRLFAARKEAGSDDIKRRSRIYSLAPVKELIKRGWIPNILDLDELEKNVCGFLGLTDINMTPSFGVPVSRRHSEAREPEGMAQIAVLMRARQLAKKHKVAKFNAARFKAAIPELLEFSKDVEGIEKLPVFFANLGVHLVIVPALAHSYMDGAVFYAGSNPVILLTLRYDGVDNFWFTLTHEVAHLVANHHGVHIDTNLEKPSNVVAEQTADKLASEWLLESATYEKFLSSSGHFYSRETVASYADSVKRHPGIVVGRLHHQNKVPYSHLRGMLEKVSPYLQKCIDTSYAV
ncbi:MAG: HigA family addiction module antitoxin [Elusimicrobiota bacterium]|nr:HigA family addiction module antitoxin [Elusimicrobiota bacterium]